MLAGEEEEGGWLYTELVVKGALKKKLSELYLSCLQSRIDKKEKN